MSMEIRVPELGESVTEATVGRWLKSTGDAVAVDEPLVELETDKAAMEVPSPGSGVMGDIVAPEGENVVIGALLATIESGEGVSPAGNERRDAGSVPPAVAPPAVTPPAPPAVPAQSQSGPAPSSPPVSPAPRRIIAENALDPAVIGGTGKGGRITKGDALAAAASPAPSGPGPVSPARTEERVKMSRLRRTIARRLKEAQETAAMLTTFNDVDMTAVMGLRKQYKTLFEEKHGIKLGFMSFFVKACTHALKEVPEVNAEIDGDEIVYRNYYDISVAVGTDRGLVVPVLRNADVLPLAGIESRIADFGRRAREGSLSLEEMQGGTFSITNGGIYGSLMSTPILNRPQSGILGMHRIEERPVVVEGEVVVRPMMYLALSYDHRIVDGKGAVSFLVRVKENLEDPRRLLLDL